MSVVTIEINGIKKELNKHDVIHCNTLEKAKKLFKALKKEGMKWSSGDDLNYNYRYDDYGSNTGYCISSFGITFSSIGFYNRNSGYHVYTFDELFMPKITIEKFYDLIKKIVLEKSDGGFTIDELYDCFGLRSYLSILLNNTPESLIEKYHKWVGLKEAEKEIKIGDIFKYEYFDGEEDQYIIIAIYDEEQYTVLWKDGSTGQYKKSEILEDKKIGHKELNLFD